VGFSTVTVEISAAGDFMAASLVAVLAGHSYGRALGNGPSFFQGIRIRSRTRISRCAFCVRAAAMKLGFGVMTMAASGITTLGIMGIPEITTTAIIVICSGDFDFVAFGFPYWWYRFPGGATTMVRLTE
jgi:hypothetical protein